MFKLVRVVHRRFYLPLSLSPSAADRFAALPNLWIAVFFLLFRNQPNEFAFSGLAHFNVAPNGMQHNKFRRYRKLFRLHKKWSNDAPRKTPSISRERPESEARRSEGEFIGLFWCVLHAFNHSRLFSHLHPKKKTKSEATGRWSMTLRIVVISRGCFLRPKRQNMHHHTYTHTRTTPRRH